MNDSGFATGWNYLKWMNDNGVSLYTTDQYGNQEINWEGLQVNPALANALSDQLVNLAMTDSSWGGLGKGKLTEVLKPYAENPLIASYIDMLDQAFEIGSTMTGYVNGYQMDLENAQSNLTDLQNRQTSLDNEIAERQARMDSRDYGLGILHNYHDDWTALYGKNGEGGGLLDQKVQVDADVEAAQAEVEALQAQIEQPVTMPATTDLDTSAVDTWVPPTKYGRVIYKPGLGGNINALYAEGGRATEPSIFGDAGAEWAIPEAHTERTAELLNAARQASGFTWGDLLSRFGGLNANVKGQSLVVHYSPTINAQNAAGVEKALAADKGRLMRLVRQMLDEQRTRDEVEVYA